MTATTTSLIDSETTIAEQGVVEYNGIPVGVEPDPSYDPFESEHLRSAA